MRRLGIFASAVALGVAFICSGPALAFGGGGHGGGGGFGGGGFHGGGFGGMRNFGNNVSEGRSVGVNRGFGNRFNRNAFWGGVYPYYGYYDPCFPYGYDYPYDYGPYGVCPPY
jgi:hypothetical protein